LFLRKSLDLGWERIALSDSAHVDSSLNLEETVVSPIGSPGILDDPVVDTIFSGSISYGNDGVVDIRWRILAYVRCINTARIVSESINDLESD